MTRIRKALVVLSIVTAMTAVSVPAQAGGTEGATCMLQEELAKYGWHLAICLGP